MKRGIVCGILPGLAALIRFAPGAAATWMRVIALPALAALNRLTSGFDFPLLEPLALLAAAVGLVGFSPVRRSPGRRLLRGTARVSAMALGMYALLWYPAYWAAPAAAPNPPDTAALGSLCSTLVDALNASPLEFADPLPEAGDVAGLTHCRVKAARYPEWMRALGVAGLFSPWTGEAVVDASAPGEYLPFTCVHELMHLKGVADEGRANLAAYRACLQRGGMFADSARLWALRYGLSALAGRDAEAARRLSARMKPALAALLPDHPPKSAANPLARVLGIGEACSSYGDLATYLVGAAGGEATA